MSFKKIKPKKFLPGDIVIAYATYNVHFHQFSLTPYEAVFNDCQKLPIVIIQRMKIEPETEDTYACYEFMTDRGMAYTLEHFEFDVINENKTT